MSTTRSTTGARRRWRRRLLIAAAVLVLVRLLAAPLGMWGLDRSLRGRGLSCSYDELDLSLSRGQVDLWHFALHPLDARGEQRPEKLFGFEHASIDVSMRDLLRGAFEIRRVGVEGLEADLDLSDEGCKRLAAYLPPADASAASAPSSSEPPKRDEKEPKPLELGLPFELSLLRLEHASLRLRDATVTPPLDTTFDANLWLRDLGSKSATARMEFTLSAPRVLDVLRVKAEGRSGGRELDAKMHVEVAALRAGAFRSQLERLGIGVLAEQLSFNARAEAKLRPQPADPRALSCAIHVDEVRALADGRETFALDSLAFAASTLSEHAVAVARLEIDGLRGNALLGENGRLAAGGFELIPGGAAREPAPPQNPSASIEAPFAWSVDELQLSNGAFHFEDRSVAPPLDLRLAQARVQLSALSNRPEDVARIDVEFTALPIANRIGLEGHLSPFADPRSVSLGFSADGLAPGPLQGYLDSLGLSADSSAGTARAQLEATVAIDPSDAVRASVSLKQVEFQEPSTQRHFFSLDTLRLDGLEFDPVQPLARIGEFSIDGLRIEALHDAQGSLHAFGLRTIQAANAPAPAKDSTPPSAPSAASQPRFELGQLRLENAAFTLRDEATTPPTVIATTHGSAKLEHFALGSEPKTANFSLSLGLESALENCGVDGTITTTSKPFGVDVAARLAAHGIDLTRFSPYLGALGLTPRLTHGEFELAAKASARDDGGTLKASAGIEGLHLRSDKLEIASIEALLLDGLEVSSGGVTLDSIAVTQPHLRVSRDAAGSFESLGLAFDPNAARPQAAAAAPKNAADAPNVAPATATPLRLRSLAVRGARLDWSDATLSPALEASLIGELGLGPLALGVESPPAEFRATLSCADNLERLEFSGRVTLPPSDPKLEAVFNLDGLRAGPLARYLPPSVRMSPRSSQARAALSASMHPAAEGGVGVEFALSDVAFGESGASTPEFALGGLRLAASRLDPDAGVFLIDELALRGTRVNLLRAADGTLDVFGFELSPPTEAPNTTAGAPLATPAQPAAAVAHSKPPRIEIGALDLGLDNLRFVDQQAGSAPIEARARLFASKPLVISGDEPENLPPLELAFDGALAPLVSALHLDLHAQPFAREPRLDVEFQIGEIDARALSQLSPSLAPLFGDGSMQHGVLSGQFGLALRLERRAPTQFDFSRDFGCDFDLQHLALRAEPGAQPVAALDDLHVDVQKISPATGAIHVKTIEIERPSATIVKRADGVHAFGLVLTPPPPAAAAAADAPAPAQVAVSPEAAPTQRPEFTLDSMILREIDLVVRDESVVPPLELTIDDFYGEVRRFTTSTLGASQPVRFQVSLGSSARPMPARDDSVHAAFDEISLSGSIQPLPTPRGWVKLDMSALDLRNLAGPAAQAGVNIGDGYLDAGVRLRIDDDGSADVDSNFTFSELSLSEPANGPISRVLNVSVPIDVMLFALENANGENVLPISVHAEHGEYGSGQLLAAAVSCVGVVVATAVASAPLRVLGSVTDLFGITGAKDPLASHAVTLDYAPGAVDLDPAQKQRLAGAIDVLSDDEVVLVAQHAFGRDDLTYGARSANPAPEECLELVARTRLRKFQLQRDREGMDADARALYAVGRNEDARSASERLRAIERELDATENALDGLLEMLRPNPERRAPKRTRRFCLDLAQARLDALAAYIGSLDVEHARERIEVRKPTFALPTEAAPLADRGRILVVPHLRKTQ